MHDIPQLDKQGLRKFGLTTGAIIVTLFGMVLPWFRERPFPWWPYCVASILLVWALAAPASLKLLYGPWMKVGLILGWINTRIILGVVFSVIILPLGLLLKLFKENKIVKMTEGFDARANTYWILRSHNHHPNMEKPF